MSFLCFSIGFIIAFCWKIKNKKHLIILLLFLSGMAIGLHEHITYQDEWYYEKSVYQDLVLDMKPRIPNTWEYTLCLIRYNDFNKCVDKK